MSARIVRIRGIDVHPNADRLVILRLNTGVDLVSGPHYEEGMTGVYIDAPALLPGWLAEDLWMVKKGDRWVPLEARIMRGVPSPGVFAGHKWRNSPDRPWQAWAPWRDRWKIGDDVTDYLGIVPLIATDLEKWLGIALGRSVVV